jgi:predicted nucleic acid-binding protein
VISIDTNLVFHALDLDSREHRKAFAFISSIADRTDVVISEFMLTELYRLVRNPAVTRRPLSEAEAVELIQHYRSHPRWRVAGFPDGSSERLHVRLWQLAGKSPFAFRRIYDARLALILQSFGVTEFATVNCKDFEGLGFTRVWNPLVS